eukprot:PhM_4_TR15337/c0_g1_i1/m.23793/K03217/yidC, spoIIIJ, OXA1, ccfA; YidC/Oxa1 family membrane protein insertase
MIRRFARPPLSSIGGHSNRMMMVGGLHQTNTTSSASLYRNTSRTIVLEPSKWFERKGAKADELPDVFKDAPTEVEDYIAPQKTTFEYIEDAWDTFISLLSPIQKQTELMTAVHIGWDIPWGGVFFMWGIMIRCITMIPSMYVNRNQLRLARIQPQITVLNDRMNKVKNDRKVSSAERKLIKDSVNRQKKLLYKKHNCSQVKSAAQMMTMPIMVSAFMAIRHLAAYEDSLETATFGWVTDLTMPDPFMIMPIMCMGLFFCNFELNQALNKGTRGALGMYARYAIRLGSVVFLYFTYHQPAAMFCYWLGLSGMGLLQPILLRYQPFRDFFNFPDPPDSVKKQNDWLTMMLNPAPTEKEAKDAAHAQYKTVKDFEVVFDQPKKKK